MSAGRFITDTLKPPVRPHSFGAISAYDGDPAHVGRIVCDATWHHFVNINLNGAGSTPEPSASVPRPGLYAGGLPTPEYRKIQTYYLNTARWLAPRGRRRCWPFLQVAVARFDFELLELQLPKPHPCPWETLLHVGLVAEDAVNRHWGVDATMDIVDDLLGVSEASPGLARLMQKPRPEGAEDTSADIRASLLPVQDMRRVILGSLVNVAAHHLPLDEEKLTALLKKDHEAVASVVTAEGLQQAEMVIRGYLQRSLRYTRELAQSLEERPER
jgi:hypothetical protein